jgi:hypothetical protein
LNILLDLGMCRSIKKNAVVYSEVRALAMMTSQCPGKSAIRSTPSEFFLRFS